MARSRTRGFYGDKNIRHDIGERPGKRAGGQGVVRDSLEMIRRRRALIVDES